MVVSNNAQEKPLVMFKRRHQGRVAANLAAAVVLLRAENERLRALLRECEWLDGEEGGTRFGYCIGCGKRAWEGHTDECAMKAALKGAGDGTSTTEA